MGNVMKDRKFKKNKKIKNKYGDPNSLKETEDNSKPYFKELAALATILGTGATGAAILPNDRVYAAQTSVDAKSQIVGSVSESTQTDLSNQGNSKSDENGVSTSTQILITELGAFQNRLSAIPIYSSSSQEQFDFICSNGEADRKSTRLNSSHQD